MKSQRLMCLALAVCPAIGFAQKREYVELQRDVATLQDQVRTLQRSLDERMAGMNVLIQQSLDSINKLNTTLAVLDSTLRDRIKDQEKSLVGPVAGIGTKVDQMSSEFGFLRESVADLNSRVGKMQQQITDLGNTMKVMQTPAAAPPGSPTSSAAPPAGLSADQSYDKAMGDRSAGNYDLALQEFMDYLRYFGKTEMAPNAQYYIGEIFYNKKDYENALKAFDAVLEVYPDNNKTLDAMYMKGRALFQMGERNQAAEAYREVLRRSPRSELAAKAQSQLKAMGLSASAAAPAARRKKR